MTRLPIGSKIDARWPRPNPDPNRVQFASLFAGSDGTRQIRVLVGMLFSGESQLQAALDAIGGQQGVAVDLVFIVGLPNKQAHDALYSQFMEHAGHYDFFVKIDADMVLNGTDALRRAIHASEAACVGDTLLPVRDWLLGDLIYGLHVFPSSAKWQTLDSEHTFTDPHPVTPRGLYIVPCEYGAVADHNPAPTEAEAFAFGLHRGAKVRQQGRGLINYNCGQARAQFALLSSIAAFAKRMPDRRRWLALIGAAEVILGRRTLDIARYRALESDTFFQSLLDAPDIDLRAIAARFWRSPFRMRLVAAQSEVRCWLHRGVRRALLLTRLTQTRAAK